MPSCTPMIVFSRTTTSVASNSPPPSPTRTPTGSCSGKSSLFALLRDELHADGQLFGPGLPGKTRDTVSFDTMAKAVGANTAIPRRAIVEHVAGHPAVHRSNVDAVQTGGVVYHVRGNPRYAIAVHDGAIRTGESAFAEGLPIERYPDREALDAVVFDPARGELHFGVHGDATRVRAFAEAGRL